jgi:glutamate racemase
VADVGPIGLFDSGVGGLSVLRQLKRLLPQEDYLYFADTLHMPYGLRSQAELTRIVFSICDFLWRERCRAIVMACNTSSALVLPLAGQHYQVPLFGMLLPGARAAAQATLNGRVGVLATEATIRSEAYTRALKTISPGIEVFGQACTALAPLVEQGELEGTKVSDAVQDCVAPVLRQCVDTLILGCTHYPFLLPLLNQAVPQNVTLIDPAEEAAREVQAHLVPALSGGGHTTFYVSGGVRQFGQVAGSLLGVAVEARQVRFKAGTNGLSVESV